MGLSVFYENATVEVEYKMIYVARAFGAPGLYQWKLHKWGTNDMVLCTYLPSAGALANVRGETVVTAAVPGTRPPEWLRAAARAEAARAATATDALEEL